MELLEGVTGVFESGRSVRRTEETAERERVPLQRESVQPTIGVDCSMRHGFARLVASMACHTRAVIA